jgi:hypothetical protein
MRTVQRVLGILAVSFVLAAGIAGCVVYETAPGVYSTTPGTSFDRSWSAAIGAFADEGVQIVEQNRSTGTIRGHVGETLVTAQIMQQADGSLRVEFEVTGNITANASLKERIVGSYNRRMGR